MGTPFEREGTYDRDELAPLFEGVATALADGRPLRLRRDGEAITVTVPERVGFELDLERDEEGESGVELELELEWTDPDGSTVQPADEGDAVEVRPEERADEATGRTSRFEVYEDAAGDWRWRLVHWNGNVVADGGEGYASRYNAERAARAVMRTAPAARVVTSE